MPANIDPIASRQGQIEWSGALIRATATIVHDMSGTIGTDIYKVFTADVDNGGYVRSVRIKYSGSSASPTVSSATVLKFFVSSVSSGTTDVTNTAFIGDIAIPAQTLSTTAATVDFDVYLGFALPPGYTILVKTTVAQPANHGFICTAMGGKY